MEITEVRIKLMEEPGERLKAFCSITFDDCFVVRDLKIIEGSSGPFVAMPSRKLTAHCPNAARRTTSGPRTATSAAAAEGVPRRPATTTAGPSSTPTSPTRSTPPAASRSRIGSSGPSTRSGCGPKSPATSPPTTTSTRRRWPSAGRSGVGGRAAPRAAGVPRAVAAPRAAAGTIAAGGPIATLRPAAPRPASSARPAERTPRGPLEDRVRCGGV